ncbi:uncharacterized protein V6R79_014561 [Siganus canaliculatus]
MTEYQYPLYFEASDLTDRERDRVRRHFQRKRVSGGGDCGPIERVGNRIYRVCFVEAEAQGRVLQRKFHTISLPSGELCLTVSRSESLVNLDHSSANQTQTLTTSKTKGLEKTFKQGIFLLHFLRNNPKANRVLQKQLDAINCTVEFNFDEEEAVVRGNIDKGPGGDFSGANANWEMQVNRVFNSFTERYLCYHVVEPKLGKMLLQDISGASDDIKVYTENGYHVVVGEKEVVEEKIDILQKNMPTCKEVPVVEKHFKLVEEEFSREARANFPEVKISRRDGMVTLEGPLMAVQAGVAKLDELIEKIQKKRVPLDSALLSFMRLSGADSKYQTRFRQSLRNPVALEIGTDLLLSSLSSDALDEAEAALQRDLSVARVALQGAEAVPPDLDKLKQILTTAKNQANSRDYRVDVSFTPGLGGTPDVTVQLVGCTENVNRLKETLHDFQMNHVGTQETLNLPHADMVDCFDKILNLIGMTQTKVTINASPFPYPCALLSGPRSEVQKVQASLTSILASFTLETLILEGPAALQYFQGDGRVSKELIENNCHVIIKEQGVNPPNLTSTARSNISPKPNANFNKVRTKVSTNVVIKPSLEIKIGNLEDEQANVLVVPMLKRQIDSTNIGESLVKKGGTAMISNFILMASNCVLVPGDILQVDAPPSLKCSKLFFIECLPWDGVRGQSGQALSQGLKRCLDLCEQQRLHSVAFPVIGPGVVLKFPLSEAIQVLTDTIRQFVSPTSSGSLSNIRVVIKPDNPDSSKFYHDIYRHLSSNMNQGGHVPAPLLTQVQQQRPCPVSGELRSLQITAIRQNSTFLFIGITRKNIDDAKKMLKHLFEAQCSTQTFSEEDLAHLAAEDLEDLEDLAKTHGLSMQKDHPSQGCLTVSGLKDAVTQVRQMTTACLQRSLRRQASIRSQEDVYNRVVWCILGTNGNWERLPKKANYNLENRYITDGIENAQGVSWRVDLKRSEATCPASGLKTTLKRLENPSDFTLPLYWDNMAAGENMKTFELQSSSPEYKTVKEAFKRAATQTVLKIERIQNIHLCRAYEAQKKRISDKNRIQSGAFEKLLYHGTSQDSCTSIMNTGFNRRFAGQHGTLYGHGTYFAVDASYSAHYCKPLADGSKLMFVARVLTGIYGQGSGDIKVPPPRSNPPHDLCDSVVDRIDNPNMFVVFHDDQAYPDYLITFK